MKTVDPKLIRDELVKNLDENFWKSLAFDKAIPRLIDMLGSEKDEVILRAATEILSRAYGRPTERTEITGRDGKDLIPADEVLSRLLSLKGGSKGV